MVLGNKNMVFLWRCTLRYEATPGKAESSLKIMSNAIYFTFVMNNEQCLLPFNFYSDFFSLVVKQLDKKAVINFKNLRRYKLGNR